MMPHRTRALLGVALQLLTLIAIAGKPQLTLSRGMAVLLETVPLDPRDLFRGDYVVLNYKISTLSTMELGFYEELHPGEAIFVGLERRGKYWAATSLRRSPPNQGVFLRGTVTSVERLRSAQLAYGIESFFVPEGRGREIEQARERLSVEVAVANNGSAVIRRFFLGDTPFP